MLKSQTHPPIQFIISDIQFKSVSGQILENRYLFTHIKGLKLNARSF